MINNPFIPQSSTLSLIRNIYSFLRFSSMDSISFFSLGFCFLSISSSSLIQDETCGKVGEVEWKCELKENCKIVTEGEIFFDEMDFLHFKNCSSDNSGEYICCQQRLRRRSIQKSRANAYCEEEMKKCKSLIWTDSSLLEDNVIPNDEPWNEMGLKPASPLSFPYLVQIGYGDINPIWACTGSIVSEKFILTSGSCGQHISLGTAKWVKGGKGFVMMADSVHIHPGYKPPSVYNNLALIQLKGEGIDLTTDYAKPVCLHTMPKVPYSQATLIGWVSSNMLNGRDVLLNVEVPLIQVVRCNTLRRKDAKAPQGVKPGTMLCGGTIESFGDYCQGFGGGPLLIKKPDCCLHNQIGVSSIAELCGSSLSPGLYTRVNPYINWIENIVWPIGTT